MSQNAPILIEETAPNPPSQNAAVQRCHAAYNASLQDSQKNDLGRYDTRQLAADAYRNAMPNLVGYESIRDFIACVTHGMVIGIIDATDGPKLLYAAQVAVGALRYEQKDQKRPAA